MIDEFIQVLLPLLSIGIVSLVAGLPIVLFASIKFNRFDQRIAIASAPIWGILTIAVVSTWAQAAGASPQASIFGVLMASVAVCVWNAMARSVKESASDIALAVLGLFAITILVLIANGSDITSVGLTNYFPITNADTFNYLGLIEQIRTFGAVAPRLHYPNGTTIYIEHATAIRLGAASVVASLSAIASVDTAQGTFLCLRLGLILAVVGAMSVAAAATRNLFAALVVGALCIGSNLLLPQTLQQFLSSVLGLSQLTAVALAAIWAIRSGMRWPYLLLLGIAAGSYALMSPESHAFVLIALAVVFLMIALPRQRLISPFSAMAVFLVSYFLPIGPLAFSYFSALLKQVPGTIHHPGDFFAAPGALLYASGIAIWDGRPFAQYRSYEQLSAIAMVLAFVIAAIGCVYQAIFNRNLAMHDRQIALFFGTTASVALIAQAYAYLAGQGFLLSKLVDYFCFLFFVAITVGIASGTRNLQTTCSSPRTGKLLERLIWTLVLVSTTVHIWISVPHKREFLNTYVKAINNAPTAQDYQFTPTASGTISGLWADLGEDIQNRYLWENRWRPIPVYVPLEITARFSGLTPLSSVSHVLRMSGPAVGTAAVVDINRARNADKNSKISIVPVRNYLKINEGAGWLGPEGSSPVEVWRWLSGRGRFMVLDPCTAAKALTLELSAGPDGGLDNDVEIHFADRRIAIVRSDEIVSESPVRRVIPLLDVCSSAPIAGTIVVTGPTRGIRQVRIGALYITDLHRGL